MLFIWFNLEFGNYTDYNRKANFCSPPEGLFRIVKSHSSKLFSIRQTVTNTRKGTHLASALAWVEVATSLENKSCIRETTQPIKVYRVPPDLAWVCQKFRPKIQKYIFVFFFKKMFYQLNMFKNKWQNIQFRYHPSPINFNTCCPSLEKDLMTWTSPKGGQTHREDIATNGLNRPKGRLSEKLGFQLWGVPTMKISLYSASKIMALHLWSIMEIYWWGPNIKQIWGRKMSINWEALG